MSIMKKLRLLFTIAMVKLVFHTIRLLRLGGGTHFPGLLGIKLLPNLISVLASQIPTHILITGTNGKTTTTHLLSHLVKSAGLNVLTNHSGANLIQGIATKLCLQANSLGKITAEMGVWEVDEFAFKPVFWAIKPQYVVLLNLFKDQLDRYGEIDTILKTWRENLAQATWQPSLLLNTDNDYICALHDVKTLKKYFYHVKGYKIKPESQNYYPKSRAPKAQFVLNFLGNKALQEMSFSFNYQRISILLKINLVGMYQLYNVCAALATYTTLNLPIQGLAQALQAFTPAFGRAEHLHSMKHDIFIFLIKNPTGASQVIYTLASDIRANDRFLIILNDGVADGTDTSWIWDTDFEFLQQKLPKESTIVLSGKRAQELAVRFKYAGFASSQIQIISQLEQAFTNARQDLLGRLFILPTYTALLPLEQLLFSQNVLQQRWYYEE